MAERRPASHTKGKGRTVTNQDWLSTVKTTVFIPFHLIYALSVSITRVITPPFIPLVALLLSIPILLALSSIAGVYVWSTGAVGWEAPLYLQYGDNTPPYAEAALPYMNAMQPYDISLHIVLPAIQSNYALGNFMITLVLATPSNKTLTIARRPAIVLPPSGSRWFRPSTETLTIPLLAEYTSGTSPIVARVEVGRRDGWKNVGSGEGREVSVLSASLEGAIVYRGIRGYISHYPLTSALVSASAFFIVSFASLAVLLLPAVAWRYIEYIEDSPSPVKVEPRLSRTASQDTLDGRRRRRRSLKRSASESHVASEDIKPYVQHEGEGETMSAAATSGSPLRRRRSRLSENIQLSDEDR
ncbi:hypothetical protein OF83DRAFT_1084145 [Amylostereum chailletii]|nr:hypothetical protein OF83DRAFT_1084145 [Amylostereum chailletii]